MNLQKAIVIVGPKQEGLVTDRPRPTVRDSYILVKTKCVALNPTDWKHVDFYAGPGALLGCDYAGVVEEIGTGVTKLFKKGDRVCGFVHGANVLQHEDGAFAEYIVAKGDIQIRIPDHMTFQEAATLGVGITTVGQSLYQCLKLNWPIKPVRPSHVSVMIYGGSTATGMLAIQFAKLSGYNIITTCSPHNFNLVKKLGADSVFNYKDASSAENINQHTNNALKVVLDTVSSEESAQYCDKALSSEGGFYCALQLVEIKRSNIQSDYTLAYTACGNPIRIGSIAADDNVDDFDFAVRFCSLAEQLLASGEIKAIRHNVSSDGFKGILDGIKLLREGKVSGEKLVYSIEGNI